MAEEAYRLPRRSVGVMESLFHLAERGTSFKTEILAGITTFMTMAYIIFVNPSILQNAGIPFTGAVTATALAAGIMSIAMGLASNMPLALAPGMGLNAVLTFGVVIGMKLPWQTAMGIVFIEGLVVTLLVLTRVREKIMDAIPMSLKMAIGVGIGLFIAFIGLKEAGIVVSDQATTVKMGSLLQPGVILSFLGLIITAILLARRVNGAILLGIIATTVLGFFFGVTKLPTEWTAKAVDFSTMFQLDIWGALKFSLLATIFAFLITDFFDTMGTVVSVGGQAGLLDKDGRPPRLRNILLVDSLAAMVGGLFGASSVTTYIESASGVGAGGRTGLTSVVTGLLFLVAVFLTPLAGIVPAQATAPALILVGFLMMSVIKDIPFGNFEEAIPAFLTLIAIPLTYSISNGIGIGFISYVLVKVFTGKAKDVHLLMWITAVIFAVNFSDVLRLIG